jgi:hypothetical protein
VPAPIDPFNPSWVTGLGQQASIVVHVRADAYLMAPTGDRLYWGTLADKSMDIPIAGQAVGFVQP